MMAESYGKYTVSKPLGYGGMAAVYLAHHPELDRQVAIKVIHAYLALDPSLGERFRREARLVASLRHPHIVQLHDFDVANDQPFMVMEYLEGGTLKQKLDAMHEKGETMSPDEALGLLESIASALDYAHARGAVHRDIKPGNILFTSQGEPVLTDFGIAKLLNDLNRLSNTGSIIGTPIYMSPEQASGKPIDARSDVYSLAIVVYEMLAGRAPFDAESPTTVLMKHMSEPPPPIRQFAPGLPEGVETVFARALAKDPADRYSTAGEFASAFADAIGVARPQHLRQPTVSSAPTLVSRPRPEAPDRAKAKAFTPVSLQGAGATRYEQAAAGAEEADAVASGKSRLLGGQRRLLAIGALVVVLAVGGLAAAPGLLSRLNAAPSGSAAPPAVRIGFRDASGPGKSDQVILLAAGGEDFQPPEGMEYTLWLVRGDERRRNAGTFLPRDGELQLTYNDPGGANLIGEYDSAEITIEPANRPPNTLPSTQVAVRGQLPPKALAHVRHVLVPGSEVNGQGGFAVGLIGQAGILQRQSELLQIALGAGDLRGLTNVAEGIINLIEGRGGDNYGDVNGDGIVNDRGDGYGLLPGKETPGYIQASREHARLAAAESDATPNMREHAPHVDVAALNTSRWTGQLHALALELAKAQDLRQVQSKVSDAVALARRVLNGQDVNGNEEIEPIPDEGGARTVMQHAQFMADLALVVPGR